jgi:hypothetical protein
LERIGPIVPPFRASHGSSWWTGNQFPIDDKTVQYPSEVQPPLSGNNVELYSVRSTGFIFIPEPGTYRFADGVDDFGYWGIDVNNNGEIGDIPEEVMIEDNAWTDLSRGSNGGGGPIGEVDFDVPAEGSWLAAAFYMSEGGGDDGAIVYWDYDLNDLDGDGIRLGDAEGFPVFDDDVIDILIDAPNLYIPDSVLWSGGPPPGSGPELQAGDADQDLDFDQVDLVRVQIAAKYLTAQAATWGDGDWNGAPGGNPGSPPAGDGVFNQRDIIASQQAGIYLTGTYGAVQPSGIKLDGQTSIVYHQATGEVEVDAPAGVRLTSINIDSAAGVFTGDAAAGLGGSFDNDDNNNIFKATFGSNFGSLSLGLVAQPDLDEAFVLNDLTVIGSLDGGGGLGEVDLVYVPFPEPSAWILGSVAIAGLFRYRRR